MSDDKEIRELLGRDFEEVEEKLSNGHGADPQTQGRALALLLRHVRVLVMRNTVTEEECIARRAEKNAPCGHWSTAVGHLVKDAPPWLLIGGYLVAKANGWIQ